MKKHYLHSTICWVDNVANERDHDPEISTTKHTRQILPTFTTIPYKLIQLKSADSIKIPDMTLRYAADAVAGSCSVVTSSR